MSERGMRLQPSIGARHRVLDSEDQLAIYSLNLEEKMRRMFGLALPKEVVVEPVEDQDQDEDVIMILPVADEPQSKPVFSFKLYDVEDLTLTIAERRWGASRPNRRATYWAPSDLGRMIGEIKDDVSVMDVYRDLLSVGSLPVTFDAIKRFGGDGKNGRKIGIIPADGEGYEFLCAEHDSVTRVFERHHKGYRYPDDYLPHITIGRIGRQVPQAKFEKAIEVAQELLPITTNVGLLEFYDTQTITIR